MEVDQVAWGERKSSEQHDDEENPEEDDNSIKYVGGKSGGKHGKGGKGFGESKANCFQEFCYTCGELGHAARECPKGKGKGKEKVRVGDWDEGGDQKGYGKGASAWPRVCFQCGSLDHLMKGYPSVKVQAVEGAEELEVLFIWPGGQLGGCSEEQPRSYCRPPEGWLPAPRQGPGPCGARRQGSSRTVSKSGRRMRTMRSRSVVKKCAPFGLSRPKVTRRTTKRSAKQTTSG